MRKPLEISIHKKSALLDIKFEDDEQFSLSAEYLRVFSPSAEVQGHSPSQAVLQFGKRDVQFLDIEAQGHYAIRITFSDGHNSGIFSWEYLYSLGKDFEENWHSYLQSLKKAEKYREPQFIAITTDKGN